MFIRIGEFLRHDTCHVSITGHSWLTTALIASGWRWLQITLHLVPCRHDPYEETHKIL